MASTKVIETPTVAQADPLSINLRHLQAFAGVATTGSVTQAAESLFRVASAVTRAVGELEASLGVTLFERKARGMLLTVYGKGLKELGEQNLAKAHYAAQTLGRSGKVLFGGVPRFNEFVLALGKDAEQVNTALLGKKIIGGLPLAKWYPELGAGASLWCATELNTKAQIDAVAAAIAGKA